MDFQHFGDYGLRLGPNKKWNSSGRYSTFLLNPNPDLDSRKSWNSVPWAGIITPLHATFDTLMTGRSVLEALWGGQVWEGLCQLCDLRSRHEEEEGRWQRHWGLLYELACKLKFRLRELTSCLCSAAALADCFEGRMAGLDGTETENGLSQPTL